MEKKYTTKGVALSILKSLLYFILWLAVSYAVVQLAALILLSKYPGSDDYDLTKMINSLSVELNIFTGCVTVLALALVAKLSKDTLSNKASINKMPFRFSSTVIIMGVAASFAIIFIFGLLYEAELFPDTWVQLQSNAYSEVLLANPFMQFLSVGLIAPLVEEILFRGFILGTLKKEMHPWIAIIISAALFSVAHGTPIAMIYTAFLGIIFGWLAVKFNSIIPSFLFHMAYNCTQAYSGGVSIAVAVLSIPILILDILSINNYFRGKKQ